MSIFGPCTQPAPTEPAPTKFIEQKEPLINLQAKEAIVDSQWKIKRIRNKGRWYISWSGEEEAKLVHCPSLEVALSGGRLKTSQLVLISQGRLSVDLEVAKGVSTPLSGMQVNSASHCRLTITASLATRSIEVHGGPAEVQITKNKIDVGELNLSDIKLFSLVYNVP